MLCTSVTENQLFVLERREIHAVGCRLEQRIHHLLVAARGRAMQRRQLTPMVGLRVGLGAVCEQHIDRANVAGEACQMERAALHVGE